MARGEKKTGMIAVRLEPEIIVAIEREADKEDRPVAAMTRILLKEAIATREAKKEKEAKGTASPSKPPRKRT